MLLDDAGALDGFSRSILIDGEVITMHAQFRPHVLLSRSC